MKSILFIAFIISAIAAAKEFKKFTLIKKKRVSNILNFINQLESDILSGVTNEFINKTLNQYDQ